MAHSGVCVCMVYHTTIVMQNTGIPNECYGFTKVLFTGLQMCFKVLDELARVTVALHRDMLRRRMGLPGSGSALSAKSIPRGATLAPQWHREATPAAGGNVATATTTTVHGATRPHAKGATAQDLVSLAGTLSGSTLTATGEFLGGQGGAGWGDGETDAAFSAHQMMALAQGQDRPLRNSFVPLAPLVHPLASSFESLQAGNVRMTRPLPEALVDRNSPPRLRPNALIGSAAATLNTRPGKGPPRVRMLPPPGSLPKKKDEWQGLDVQ